MNLNIIDRSSRLKVFCKKGVLKDFAKFTGKQLFCNKVFIVTLCGTLEDFPKAV